MFYDSNNVELQIGDVVEYDDIEHDILKTTGTVRKNLIGIWEVVNMDLQSGNDLVNITNITKWQ